jgi:hypothetical protein
MPFPSQCSTIRDVFWTLILPLIGGLTLCGLLFTERSGDIGAASMAAKPSMQHLNGMQFNKLPHIDARAIAIYTCPMIQ